MPSPASLTVRAFGILLESPLHEYERILLDQKYPKREPTSYRVHYYSSALSAIRHYFQANRQLSVIQQAIVDIQASGMKPAHKVDHNIRTLRSFTRYAGHRNRNLTVQPTVRTNASMQGVILRFSPDLSTIEGGDDSFIVYNFRDAPMPDQFARAILELGHWVLQKSGIQVPAKHLTYVDLFVRKTHRFQLVRKKTIQRAQKCARVVAQMWPTL